MLQFLSPSYGIDQLNQKLESSKDFGLIITGDYYNNIIQMLK